MLLYIHTTIRPTSRLIAVTSRWDHRASFYMRKEIPVGMMGGTAGRDLTSTGDWHHLVMTYDGNYICGYIDNGLVVGPSSITAVGTSRPAELTIGGEHSVPGYFNDIYRTHAIFDEVGVLNRALTTVEITELYDNGLCPEFC